MPFPAIWEAFLVKIFMYAARQPMVALRLDSDLKATRLVLTFQRFFSNLRLMSVYVQCLYGVYTSSLYI